MSSRALETPPAIPATPRKRAPRARNLATTGANVRDAIAACAGRALTTFALAQIAALQEDANFREEPPRLDNEADSAPAKPWQTFANLVSDEPEKNTTAPVTVATGVKMACAALLFAVADLANALGKLPAEPLGALGQSDWREANAVRLMVAATAGARHLLKQAPLCRDLDYPEIFRQKFEAIVGSKANVDPGSGQIARLYVDFLKVIAWHAGTRAYEGEHLTLNLVEFYSIFASLQGAVSEADGLAVRDILSLVRAQVEQWEAARARALAAKKRAAPKKGAARPPARGASRRAAADPPAPEAPAGGRAPGAAPPPPAAGTASPPPAAGTAPPPPAAGTAPPRASAAAARAAEEDEEDYEDEGDEDEDEGAEDEGDDGDAEETPAIGGALAQLSALSLDYDALALDLGA